MRALSFRPRLVFMSRRSFSSSPPRDAKRPRLEGLTPDDYRNGVMLAPMVRSGARTSHFFFFSISHLRVFSSHEAFRSQAWRKAGLGSRDGRQGYVKFRTCRGSCVSPHAHFLHMALVEITVSKLYQGRFHTTGSKSAPCLLATPSRSRTSSFKLVLPTPILQCRQRV